MTALHSRPQTVAPVQLLHFFDSALMRYWDVATNLGKGVWHSYHPVVPLRTVLTQRKEAITIDDDTLYKRCRVQWYGDGIALRDTVPGRVIKTKKQYPCRPDDFLVAEIDAKDGGFGIVPPDLAGAIVSSHYFLFEIDQAKLLPAYLGLFVKTNQFMGQVQAVGSTNYSAVRPHNVLEYLIALPPLAEQARLVAEHDRQLQEAEQKRGEAEATKQQQQITLYDQLGIELQAPRVKRNGFFFIDYKELVAWGLDKNGVVVKTRSSKWPVVNLETHPVLYEAIYRGKSPMYANEDPTAKILNQKCVRWNSIDTQYAKTVSSQWLARLDASMKTQIGDILVNSTGEGTIGRAAVVENEAANMAFDSHVLLLRPDFSQLNAFLFAEIINSPYGQRQIEDLKSGQTTNQTELGVGNLRKILFPLPDLSTQQVIVKKLWLLQEHEQDLLTHAATLEAAAKATFEAAIFA